MLVQLHLDGTWLTCETQKNKPMVVRVSLPIGTQGWVTDRLSGYTHKLHLPVNVLAVNPGVYLIRYTTAKTGTFTVEECRGGEAFGTLA